MKSPLRLLVLGDSRSFHLERLLPELSRQGCAVLFASVEDGMVPHEPLGRPGLHLPAYLQAIAPLQRLIVRFQPDLINAHFVSGYGALAAIALRNEQRLPIVVHGWGSDLLIVPHKSFLHRWKVRHALQQASLLITDSEYLGTCARRIVPQVPTCVIPWGIEREPFERLSLAASSQQPVRVIMNRPLEPIYDPLTALRAVVPLLAAGTVQLSLPTHGSLVSQARSLLSIAAGSVQWYQRMERLPFLTFVAQHQLYLSASTSDSSPASLIEALGLGLQGVIADIEGVREWTSRTKVELFPVGDAAAATEAIKRSLACRDHWPEQAAEHRGIIRRLAIFEENVSATIEQFHAIVEQFRR